MPRPRYFAPRLLVLSLLSTALILPGCARRPQDPFASLRENESLAATDDRSSTAPDLESTDSAEQSDDERLKIQVTGGIAEQRDATLSRQEMIDQFLADTISEEPRSVAVGSPHGLRRRHSAAATENAETEIAETDPYVSPDLTKVSKLRQLMLEDPPAQAENPLAELKKSMAELDAQRSVAVPLLQDEMPPMSDPFEVLRQLETEADAQSTTETSVADSVDHDRAGELLPSRRDGAAVSDFDRFLDNQATAEVVVDSNPFAAPPKSADTGFHPSAPPFGDTPGTAQGTAPELPDSFVVSEPRTGETDRLPEIHAASNRVEILSAPAENSLQVTVADESAARPSAADWDSAQAHSEPPAPATPGQDPALVVANFVGSDDQQRPIVRVEANRPVSIADPAQIAVELEPQLETVAESDPPTQVDSTTVESAEPNWHLDGTRMEQLQAPMGPELNSPEQLAMAAPAPQPAAEPVNLATVRLDDIEFADPQMVQPATQQSHWWFVAGGLMGAVVIGIAIGRLRARKSS